MTLSEYVQAHRIRELLAGRDGTGDPPPLRCGNGTVLMVTAGTARGRLCYPADDAGPWTMFSVHWMAGPAPPGYRSTGVGVSEHAGALVRLLEQIGWPPELGTRWKKTPGAAGRK